MSFTESQFAALLAANPTKHYGIHGDSVYEFTGLYDNILTSLSPPQEVSLFNVTTAVNAAIAAAAGSVPNGDGTETSIFNILNTQSGTANLADWQIVELGTFTPTITYNDDDMFGFMQADSNRYISRLGDAYYDIINTLCHADGIQTLDPDVIKASIVDDFPEILGVGGVGSTLRPNDEVFDITNERDASIGTIDFNDFTLPLVPQKTTTLIGKAEPWMDYGSNVPFVGTNNELGLQVSVSKDGLTTAISRRTTPGVTPILVDVQRFNPGTNTWAIIGSTITRVSTTLSFTAKPRNFTSLSDNGNILAVGDEESDSDKGSVTVYEFSGSSWDPLGSPIVSVTANDFFGHTVKVSGDGTHFIATTNNAAGRNARIFQYDSVTDMWILIDTIGLLSDELHRTGIAINYDGSAVAIGESTVCNPIPFINSGVVSVYRKQPNNIYTADGGEVETPGQIISNNINTVLFGESIDFDSSGTRIVIGASESGVFGGEQHGSVEVYRFNGLNWILEGVPIFGDFMSDRFGRSVSMSSNGARIAVGARNGEIDELGINITPSYIKVLEFTGGYWRPLGAKILLTNPMNGDFSYLGEISGSGRKLVLGAPGVSMVRPAKFNAVPEVFGNDYDVIRTESVMGNFITDLSLRGTDNDPDNLALSVCTIDGFSFGGLMDTAEPGFDKELPILDGIVYINSNGIFRYDNDGNAAGTPSFTYSVQNTLGTKSEDSATVRFNLITDSNNLAIALIPNGTVNRKVGDPAGVHVSQGLTGTLIVVGNTIPLDLTFGIQDNTGSTATEESKITPDGTLTVNKMTGIFIYVVNAGVLPNVVDLYSDIFVFTVTDNGNGATATANYSVVFSINSNVLVDPLDPLRGSVVRNPTAGLIQEVGLEGRMVPAQGGGLLPFLFGIKDKPPTAFASITMVGDFGTLSVNQFTGVYSYEVTGSPTTTGSFEDPFIMTVMDANGEMQEISYIIGYTINNTPLGLLPIFTDVENRSRVTYWSAIIHNAIITTASIELLENTEILVIGETDNADADGILRQLLESAIETASPPNGSGSGGEDVLTAIKTNSKSLLEANDRSGLLLHSLSFNGGDRIAELSDILSSGHENFLLNRYRSNIGEALVVFYTLASTIADLVNQIDVILDLGVGRIILVSIGYIAPPGAVLTQQLETKEADLISAIAAVRPEALAIILRSSIGFNGSQYQNVTGQLQYQITNQTQTLFSAISQVPEIMDDESRALRVVITASVPPNNLATGEVVFGNIGAAPPNNFITSRLLNGNRVLTGVSSVKTSRSGGLDDLLTIQGLNVNMLMPGDILYSISHTYQQPFIADILLSVVSAVSTPAALSMDMFMQIDDGARFPDNRVFKATLLTVIQRFDSNTLQTSAPNGMFEFGFDYLIKIMLPTNVAVEDTFGAAGLEEYILFPRLGFVTFYFGRQSMEPMLGITPYGRGAIINIDRT